MVDAATVNLSCEGFYCVCRQSFPLGESVTSVIELLAPGGRLESESLTLHCKTIVVRVEKALDGDESQYGVAFRILSYSVLRP